MEAETKTTSVKIPLEWWKTLKHLGILRTSQGGAKNLTLGSILVEVMGRGMASAREELADRERTGGTAGIGGHQ